MTRAAIIMALAVSAAAAAQQQAPPLPLPGADQASPSPAPAEKKPDAKKEKKKAPPPLPVPALDLAPSKASAADAKPPPLPLPASPDQKQPGNMLPLPGLDLAPSASKPVETKAPSPAAPPAAPPAATATAAPKAAPPATRTLTADRIGPSTGAGAPPSASMATPSQLGDLRLRPDQNQQLWTIRGLIGGERSTEQDYTDSASLSRLGVEGTRWLSGPWLARAEIDWRNSRQAYVPLHSAGATPRVVMVDENRFDVAADIGYDLGPRMVDNGRLEFTPMLGVQYIGIRNSAFPTDLFGPSIGGRARFALSPAVQIHATLGYTYNLTVATNQNSALKSPKGDFNARAGLALPLQGGFALELDYSGDVLGFENTYRVAHGAALGFGTSF